MLKRYIQQECALSVPTIKNPQNDYRNQANQKRDLMYKRLFVLFATYAVTCSVNAASINDKNHGDLLVDEITSIYDGDTFRANIVGIHPLIGERIGIRVSGVDTPEIRGKCKKEKELAKKAKQVTVRFLRNSKTIELRNVKRGKYFRIVADVYGDNESLTKALIDSELAVPYYGGKKAKNWCE